MAQQATDQNQAFLDALDRAGRLATEQAVRSAEFEAHPITQRLTAICNANRRPITADGMAGGAQVFLHLVSPENAKKVAAGRLLGSRQVKGASKRRWVEEAGAARRAAMRFAASDQQAAVPFMQAAE